MICLIIKLLSVEIFLLLNKNTYIIAIAGGTGSGKTYLVNQLIEKFGHKNLLSIEVDSYYKDLAHLDFKTRAKNNFDHPSSFDFNLLKSNLKKIKNNKNILIPIYDYKTHTRCKASRKINPPYNIILLEGIFALYPEDIRSLIDYSIFIDINEKIRIKRRIDRDIKLRSRTQTCILKQYEESVKPMYNHYVEPTKEYANLIIKKFNNSDSEYVKLLSIINNRIK